MKKFLLSSFVVAAFGFYVLYQKVSFGSGPADVVPPPTISLAVPSGTGAPSGGTGSGASNSNSGSNPPSNSKPGTGGGGMMGQGGMGGMTQGQYKNGQYTGSVADAFYGNVQVEVTIQNGQITNVQFLQYPSDRSTSIYINSQAMPLLAQEAVQAQSAQIDGVSGATATSGAFVQSLASALAQAKI